MKGFSKQYQNLKEINPDNVASIKYLGNTNYKHPFCNNILYKQNEYDSIPLAELL